MAEIAQNNTETVCLPVLTFATTANSSVSGNKQQQVQCLKCSESWTFPAGKDEYLAHLFVQHRLVIADVEEIALLEHYLQHWQKQFKDKQLDFYCTTMLLDQLPDGTPAKNEKYFLLSSILQEDYDIRKKLAQQRLEHALAQHQFERSDRSFCKECLFCRDVITGLRADYLEHLFGKHFLHLGRAENLVYIDDLLAKIQNNLEQLICLYCEKVFKDRMTLKEHMRKKAHKCINPSNRAYDQFFLINYRNDKQWKPTQKKQQQKPMQNKNASAATRERCGTAQSSVDFNSRPRRNSNNTDDSDWSDWQDETAQQQLNCLYCKETADNLAALKLHMLSAHAMDFDAALQPLNFYQRIKAVNYVRRQICLLRCVTCDARCDTLQQLLQHMQLEMHFTLGTQKQWHKPEYFFSTYEDDGLLCLLDDNANDDALVEADDAVVHIISEDAIVQINKDAERLSLESFNLL